LVGRESSDLLTANKETNLTYGFGLDWAPTERTQVSAIREKRYFGHSHRFSLAHRAPRSSWSISDTQEPTTTAGAQVSGAFGLAHDLFSAALTTRFPDPAQREAETRRLLSQSGISPNLNLVSSFATNRTILERRRQVGFALLRARDTAAVAVYRTDRRALGEGSGASDDFTLSNEISQTGLSVDWSHAISGLLTLNVSGGKIRTTGSNDQESDDASLTLSLSAQIGPRTTGSVGVRHRRFDSSAESVATDFRENALFAAVAHHF
jgi:uncharacterized protein (PEP-CTERM system associated)